MRNAKKLGELLEMAMTDLKLIEADPRFQVCMYQFYDDRGASGCLVCLAGASLVKRCELAAWIKDDPLIDDLATTIDYLRRGWVVSAYARFYRATMPEEPRLNRVITNYHSDQGRWWQEMTQLLTDIKAAGY